MKKIMKWNRFLACAMALGIGSTAFLVGCTPADPDDPDPDDPIGGKTVTSIEIATMPTQTEFYVGDDFNYDGGELLVTYSDGSSETIPFTAEGVTVTDVPTTIPDDSDSQTKTVTVRYEGERVTYNVTVTYRLFNVTFDYNYDDMTEVVSVRENFPVDEPETPVREDYDFNGWYSDEALTASYDFETPVTADMTLYAGWLSTVATYFTVTFDNNYEDAVRGTTQQVEDGATATQPSVAPTRKGYEFIGWTDSPAGTAAFDFSTPITANTTLYAMWERDTASLPEGTNTFVFEAENTNLDGKVGVGLSGTAPGAAMIQTVPGFEASGDQFVGYLYQSGLALTFTINSDREVDDATIVLRLSAEYGDLSIDGETFIIEVGSEQLQYNIDFVGVPSPDTPGAMEGDLMALPFDDYLIAENVHLEEGDNYINLMVNNDMTLEGTTMTARAPLVDCLKITTSAVLDWSARAGLPKQY